METQNLVMDPEYYSYDYYEPQPPLFQQTLNCLPFSKYRNPELESGDRIILPISCFDKLTNLDIPNPWLFKIQTCHSDEPVVSHCSVLEFQAEEGFVYMPEWMMKNLEIEEKHRVVLEHAFVPKGRYMKLQPHTTSFVMLPDPKEILEQNLRLFSCLSLGDTFMIRHEDKEYYIDVVEVSPGDRICLTDTDCEVDFATPLDYKEPERKAVVSKEEEVMSKKEEVVAVPEEEKGFKAFTGKSRRLVAEED